MRVVVIEDEPDLRRLLVEEIADLGHEAYEASSGPAGIDLVREVQPHVICSDINMPEMDGHAVKEHLDNAGLIDGSTVFIFLSANATRTDIADGLMAGAAHYFTKPIDFDRLAAVLDRVAATLSGNGAPE
ncbi:MAG: response regulator [Pseudomonadota bacterium]